MSRQNEQDRSSNAEVSTGENERITQVRLAGRAVEVLGMCGLCVDLGLLCFWDTPSLIWCPTAMVPMHILGEIAKYSGITLGSGVAIELLGIGAEACRTELLQRYSLFSSSHNQQLNGAESNRLLPQEPPSSHPAQPTMS